MRQEFSADLKGALLPLLDHKTKLLIAYSGGLDSHVLLHLFATLRPNSVRAVHVHHGINEAADHWADHCKNHCQQLSIPFTLLRVNAQPVKGESREERARNLRYKALESELKEGEWLLTAQHREDQAETLLLQLFRGCGVKGLAAMPLLVSFGCGQLARPLLNFSQQWLQQYANDNELCWIEDSSNQDQSYDRNYLRQTIIPQLEVRWPTISGRLARTSNHCGEALSLLDGLADHLLDELLSADKRLLLVAPTLQLTNAQQRLALRRWIESQNVRPPSTKQLNQIVQEVLRAPVDAMPSVSWGGHAIRRYRNRLYLTKLFKAVGQALSLSWSPLQESLEIKGLGELNVEIADGVGIAAGIWNDAAVVVRFRQGGERLKPIGRNGHHSLKKLFQEAAIPPWMRERYPLIYLDDKLAAVQGLWVADWCKGDGEGKDLFLTFIDSSL